MWPAGIYARLEKEKYNSDHIAEFPLASEVGISQKGKR
jgi:hypothetical protein